MSLPKFQSDSQPLNMLQTKWASIIDPVLSKELNNGLLLKDIDLVIGDNVINHKLGRNLQGWIVTRMQGAFAQLYDKQNNNQMCNKTLVLNSNAVTICDLWVF